MGNEYTHTPLIIILCKQLSVIANTLLRNEYPASRSEQLPHGDILKIRRICHVSRSCSPEGLILSWLELGDDFKIHFTSESNI